MRTHNEAEVGELLHQRGWRTEFTVAERVSTRAELTSLVEHGYGDTIDEYTNNLYCRNWLHEAWILLDDHIVQLWTPRIKAVDDQFRATTVADDGQALGKFHKPPHPDLWWWRRHPRLLTGNLGDSLRSVVLARAEHGSGLTIWRQSGLTLHPRIQPEEQARAHRDGTGGPSFMLLRLGSEPGSSL
ncbi:hypothetical protein OG897_15960 [Streptomyces sp. NBC_00237]|uniref:hypothetical protein n=1 Tax=Streptomyces sp. NBC_00237 TaxID=2975687 RepID=UPI0022504FC7|nr:hypothetical protein [Streptomyces sp. NBC_00237]MCX5202939.1 hypothetical protein [Streptomyces sp. NBC_00237]